MYIFYIIFITSLIGISHSIPVESPIETPVENPVENPVGITKTKKLMPIDLSKLGNNYNALHGSSFYTFPGASNIMRPSQESKLFNIDLSALRLPPTDTFKQKEVNSLEDVNSFNSLENKIPDIEYDNYQPLRIIPHRLYFNAWKPEIPGNDALTDFLHEEYRNGRLVYNGKRDYSSQEWEDNEIPILLDQTKPCIYNIPKEYGIDCDNFFKLINDPMHSPTNANAVKRNMFLSNGWGPSGSYINIPSKIGVKTSKDTKFNNYKKLPNLEKSNESLFNKNQRIRQKQENRKSNAHRWSVPHLFGSY